MTWIVAYVGIRGPQPDYGHGGPRVVGVIRNGEKRTLTLADERYLHQESFEWGYDGAGPLLAHAILNDYLGVEVDPLVARVFASDVIARLPSEFELDGRDVARWLNERLASALRDEANAFGLERHSGRRGAIEDQLARSARRVP